MDRDSMDKIRAAGGWRDEADVANFSSSISPQGEHKATIVWLHDKDDHFSDSVKFARTLGLKNVNWKCPPIVYKNTSYDFGSNIKKDDQETLDNAAFLVASLLSGEPPNVIKGVGGCGMGAVVALHFAKNCALGQYPINPPRVVVGIDGWLSIVGSIKSSIESTVGASARVASQSILLTHAQGRTLPYTSDEEVVVSLKEAGFGEVLLVPYSSRSYRNVTNEVKFWLELKLSQSSKLYIYHK
ncbi:PREDICTED: uncharacterized protein LOC104759978 [Camelina sativa]|uniref:Uncharacterized protein LOC104759978 n=1 Tax=Camelina sativa TaxID=90675 RepID=A0ABM0X5Q8_CAMSA|nr:PREDICTED: uncharacterized protein LOC104759978 [Camelina sativa]